MNASDRIRLYAVCQKLRDVNDSDFDWASRIVEAYANEMLISSDRKANL